MYHLTRSEGLASIRGPDQGINKLQYVEPWPAPERREQPRWAIAQVELWEEENKRDTENGQHQETFPPWNTPEEYRGGHQGLAVWRVLVPHVVLPSPRQPGVRFANSRTEKGVMLSFPEPSCYFRPGRGIDRRYETMGQQPHSHNFAVRSMFQKDNLEDHMRASSAKTIHLGGIGAKPARAVTPQPRALSSLSIGPMFQGSERRANSETCSRRGESETAGPQRRCWFG